MIPAPIELRLTPVDHPGLTISIPATTAPSHGDDLYRFRLRLIEEDAPTREALRELVAIRARGVGCLASFGDRRLGPCVVELLTAGERASFGEYRFELVLHRKKLFPASPEKDPSDGQEERALAPWAQELLGLPRVVSPLVEEAIQNALAFGVGILDVPSPAHASTDPGQGAALDGSVLAEEHARIDELVVRSLASPRPSPEDLPRAIAYSHELASRLLAERYAELRRRVRGELD